jgi:hypothetical protein
MRLLAVFAVVILFCGCFENPIVSNAVKAGDPELCRELESEGEMLRCFGRVAEAKGDKDMCKAYLSQHQGRLDECMSSVGSKMGDISACDEISDRRKMMSCYAGVGRKNNDPDVCASIDRDEISLRESCFLDVATDLGRADICENIEAGGHYHRQCYTSLAVKNSSPKLCSEIQHDMSRDLCYRDVAQSTGWQNVCGEISNTVERRKCDSQVTGNPMGCEGLAESDLDDCIYISSEKGGIVSECMRIGDKYRREECVRRSAVNAGNPELCEGLPDSRLEDCVNDASIRGKSTTGCKSLGSVGRRNTCVKAVALQSLSLKDCEEITVARMVDECKIEVTRERKKQGLEDKDFGERVGEFIGGLLGSGPDLSTNSTTTTQPSSGDGGSLIFDLIGWQLF